MPRKRALVQLITFANTKEHLNELVEAMAGWREAKRLIDARISDELIGRCVNLNHPEMALSLLETMDYNESGSKLPTLNHLSNYGRASLDEFFRWHNPPSFNKSQVRFTVTCIYTNLADFVSKTLSKWAARFTLAFSTSVPACRFLPSNIHEIPDIKPSAGCADREIMTDGCGFMNKAGK